MLIPKPALLAATLAVSGVTAQTFQRLGTCPDLGCILPPDQQDFLPGQEFDIRFEIHAPQNGSEAKVPNASPDINFTATIVKQDDDSGGNGKGKAKGKGKDNKTPAAKGIREFFGLGSEPSIETWSFQWYEDLFARDARKPSVVKVASKVFRRVALYEPGVYTVTLEYEYAGEKRKTEARWTVRELATKRRAKNVIFFIGWLPFHSICVLKSQVLIMGNRGWNDHQYDHGGETVGT
jgi:hypothetical protein